MGPTNRLPKWICFVLLQLVLLTECRRVSRTFVTLNPTARLGFGIQITLPLSFFMPNFGFFGRHSRAGRQFTSTTARRRNHWRRPDRTSLLQDTCSDDGVPVEDYLHLLHIDVESCQQRFICEMASDPARFQPLSEIFLRKVARLSYTGKRWLWKLNTTWSAPDGHYDLALAARRGVESSGAACSKHYEDCPVTADSMINMSLLFLWRLIASAMNIRFSVRGVLCDITGVLYDSGGKAIEGSPEAIHRLKEAGIPLRFVTNESQSSRQLLVDKLRELGFYELNVEEVFSPAPAVTPVLRSRGLRPFLLTHPDLLADFKDIDVNSPNCVVVGDASEYFTFTNMNRAFQILINEKEPLLFALGKGKFYKHGGALTLDLGAYVSALEYSCDVKAQIYGKPTKEFFEAAIRDMGLDPVTDEVLMIGDDIVNDVGGAQACGFKAALVRTGKYRITDENHPDVKPDVIVDNLAAVVDLLLGE